MKVHVLKQQQLLPISLEKAWDFFSTPRNLDKITPADIGFKITYSSSDKMIEGQIITYKIRIMPLIYVTWVTEITNVKEPSYFIDNQISGPYRLWHHRHTFESCDEGVIMNDLIHYSLPFGIIGSIAHALFVKKKLSWIFNQRKTILEKLFA
jgi:ligand-binding SRPBCC domain-containing protein